MSFSLRDGKVKRIGKRFQIIFLHFQKREKLAFNSLFKHFRRIFNRFFFRGSVPNERNDVLNAQGFKLTAIEVTLSGYGD